MSNAIFPSLPGLMWDVVKSPLWNTKVQASVGGKELRAQFFSTPIYKWQLRYELLRASALQELQSLLGFFNARQGKFDSFLFTDPNDNTVSGHGFGVGDGVTTTFQLQRSLAGPRLDTTGLLYPVYTVLRGNYLLQSQSFFTPWAGSNEAAVGNQLIAPDGTMTAAVVNQGSAAPGSVFQVLSSGSPAVPAGKTFTFSIWLVAGSLTGNFVLRIRDGADANETAVTITPTGTWTRYSVTATMPGGAAANLKVYVDPANDSATGNYGIWGGQVEDGTVVTPYIPTGATIVFKAPSYWPVSGDGFEPVYDLNTATPPVIRKNGVVQTSATHYTISPTGLVTFVTAPASLAQLTWDGSYYWRVRFDQDAADFSNFLYQLWELKQLTLVSVK